MNSAFKPMNFALKMMNSAFKPMNFARIARELTALGSWVANFVLWNCPPSPWSRSQWTDLTCKIPFLRFLVFDTKHMNIFTHWWSEKMNPRCRYGMSWTGPEMSTCNHSREIYQAPACIYSSRDLSSAGMYILKQRSINRRHVYTQAEIYQSPACIYKSDSI